MAAAALAKMLHGKSSRLLPAIGRRVPSPPAGGMLIPQPSSSMANPATGMGRLMHTGQWRNPLLSQGGGSVPPKVEQFSSKRSLHWWRDDNLPLPDHPVNAFATVAFLSAMVSFAFSIPTIYRSAKGLYKTFK